MTSIARQTDPTDAAINQVGLAGDLLLLAVAALDKVEADRALEKLGAMRRLTLLENPATPGKNFTASAAADFAQFDEGYAAYTARRAEAARQVMAREHDRELAQFRALAQIRVAASVVAVKTRALAGVAR